MAGNERIERLKRSERRRESGKVREIIVGSDYRSKETGPSNKLLVHTERQTDQSSVSKTRTNTFRT